MVQAATEAKEAGRYLLNMQKRALSHGSGSCTAYPRFEWSYTSKESFILVDQNRWSNLLTRAYASIYLRRFSLGPTVQVVLLRPLSVAYPKSSFTFSITVALQWYDDSQNLSMTPISLDVFHNKHLSLHQYHKAKCESSLSQRNAGSSSKTGG